ncbi:tetratricopeptide repeat protein [Lysobacter enzymogenes]|nr:tetratricopeptide repeat protein [Lysobacter enzymogenes]
MPLRRPALCLEPGPGQPRRPARGAGLGRARRGPRRAPELPRQPRLLPAPARPGGAPGPGRGRPSPSGDRHHRPPPSRRGLHLCRARLRPSAAARSRRAGAQRRAGLRLRRPIAGAHLRGAGATRQRVDGIPHRRRGPVRRDRPHRRQPRQRRCARRGTGARAGQAAAAAAVEGEDAVAANQRGEAAYRGGDLAAAIAAYQQAIELDPGYALAFSNLGLAYVRKGRAAEAIWTSRRAIALAKGPGAATIRAGAYYNIGKLYELDGQYERAMSNYLAAKREKPDKSYDEALQRVSGY